MSVRGRGRGVRSRWAWIATRLARKIWFRAGIISLASVLLAVVAALVTPYLPVEFGGELGQSSVGTILEIMASSMLAVTTFSLTAMVSAYSSATQLATPRATQLMISDPTSQNALSTFLGAFVFAIVGIIGLQTNAYGQDGRILLFGATVVIVVLVVVTLLRWIGHITAFGRMSDVIDRVEEAACTAMAAFADSPYQGARPAVPLPSGARALCPADIGYVTHIDVRELGRIAETGGLIVHVTAPPGAMVHAARGVMAIEGDADDKTVKDLLDAFTIERHRSFDSDPRLGLIALSEIASRALAPATNDPGTAIEVLNALLRAFAHLPADRPDAAEVADRPPVYMPRPTIEDMLDDAFRPILREGGREVEVAIRLSATLAAIAATLPHADAPLRRLADQCRRCADGIESEADRAAFDAAHARHWG